MDGDLKNASYADAERRPLEASAAAPKGRGLRRALLFLAGLVVLGGLATGGVLYWLDARQYESTDDAFVDGHISQIASQIPGRVTRLAVDDNQEVAAGQVLLELDPRDYQMKLDQARAQLAQAAAQAEQARAQIPLRQSDIDQALAQVRVAESDAAQAQSDYNRYRGLSAGAISRQTVDNAGSAVRSQQAKVDAMRQAVVGFRAQLDAQRATADAAEAGVQLAQAEVANAELQLSYSRIVAPQAGRVAKRTVELGNYVKEGQALLSVVADRMWITANFKETQLGLMKSGQEVDVRIDAIPGPPFRARLQSFQAGSGNVFSSLPAENATGNYVKVVQRVPVKIMFVDPRADTPLLAPGLSAVPRVKVR